MLKIATRLHFAIAFITKKVEVSPPNTVVGNGLSKFPDSHLLVSHRVTHQWMVGF
jgi:hypothetical protein